MTPQYKHHQSHRFTAPSLLPPHLGSSSHPYFHILLGYSFLSSPFSPSCFLSLFLYFLHCPLFFPLFSILSPVIPLILVPFSPVPSSLSATWGYLWDLEGWDSSGTDASLNISSTEPISAAVLCIILFTPLHISCLIQSGPCDPNMLFLWEDSDERGNQNPYRKSNPTDLLLLATRLARLSRAHSFRGTLFFRLLTDLCIKLLIFFCKIRGKKVILSC